MSTKTRRAARAVMWAAIGGSLALLGLLLALDFNDRAWTIAAGVLLAACIGVCIWGAAQGRITERDVRRAVERLSAARDEQARRGSLHRSAHPDSDR